MYVGVVELLRNLPLYGGRFDSPLIRDLESRRDVLTGQSTGWALVYATSRRSLRLLCCEYGQIECKNLYAIWRRNHGERSAHGIQQRKGDGPANLSNNYQSANEKPSKIKQMTKMEQVIIHWATLQAILSQQLNMAYKSVSKADVTSKHLPKKQRPKVLILWVQDIRRSVNRHTYFKFIRHNKVALL